MSINTQSQVEEYLIIGPPGTGKTHYVARQAQKAVKKYGSSDVLLCSLTVAAAREMATRGIAIAADKIGTLHGHCYRALGKPPLAEAKEALLEWNKTYPEYRIETGGNVYESRSSGADILMRINYLRARGKDIVLPSGPMNRFWRRWQDFKAANGLMDFADIIEEGYHSLPTAPGNPSVIIVDEAQDLSTVEYAIIRRWAGAVTRSLIVGDKLQCLYSWRGADEKVLDPSRVDDEHLRVLSRSWRLPRAVQQYAVNWVRKRIHGAEAFVEYAPKDDTGFVVRSGGSCKTFNKCLALVMQYVEQGKTVMVLASCGYMLHDIVSLLREEGVPYHNPYTDRWNPLGDKTGTTMKDRLLAWLGASEEYMGDNARFWTSGQLMLAAGGLVKVLKHGYKKKLRQFKKDNPREVALFLHSAMDGDNLEKFTSFDIEWWFNHVKGGRDSYLRQVIRKNGLVGITEEPRVVIGTIHSVKGGEADVVFLFPDLSMRGYEQTMKPGFNYREGVFRMFYVGMTRAKEGLVLCEPSVRRQVRW